MLSMAKLIARLFLLLTFAVLLIHAGAQTAPNTQTAPSAQAAPADNVMPPELTAIKTTLNNIGYTTTDADDKLGVIIKISGKYDYPTMVRLSVNKKVVYICITLLTLKPEEVAKFPFVKALEFDDAMLTFFTMAKSTSGPGEVIFKNTYVEVSGLTPQLLRERIDALRRDTDESDVYWNPELWK